MDNIYICIAMYALMDTQNTQQVPGQQQQPFPFYQNLGKALFQGESEKSLVDKLLGRQDADKLHQLMKKEPLTRSDLEEIMFLMTSIDQKIVNYDSWDRYVIVKLFPWIKDYSTVAKTWMLYEEEFQKGKHNDDFTIEKEIETTDPKTNTVTKETIKPIYLETYKIVQETSKYIQHNLKFLISVFLLVQNSTLSIDGAAFETLTTSRYEYSYPSIPLPQPQQRGTIMNLFSKKK